MATQEQLEKARQNALLSPRIGQRGKGKKTLEAEAFKKIFIEKVSQFWNRIIDVEIQDALKDRQAREYIISHIIGKPRELKELLIREKTLSQKIMEGSL